VAQVQADPVLPQQLPAVQAQPAHATAAELDRQALVAQPVRRGLERGRRRGAGRRRIVAHEHPRDLARREREREHHAGGERLRLGLDELARQPPPLRIAQPALPPGREVQRRLGLHEPGPLRVVRVDGHELGERRGRHVARRPAAAGLDQQLLGAEARAALQVADRLQGGGDRRAGQHVVELAEEQVLPGGVQALEGRRPLRGILDEPLDRPLGPRQRELAAPLPALDVLHHAVAAREGVLQLGLHDREDLGALAHRREERLRGGEAQLGAVHARMLEDPLDVRPRRPAAVVAHAVEAHGVPERRIHRGERRPHLLGEVLRPRHIPGDDAEAEHLGPAAAPPAEGRRGERDAVGVRAVEDVGVAALLRQQVGQGGRVPERVDVVGDGGREAEAVDEVAPAMAELAPPALGRRQVRVGLHDHRAGDVPLPAAHERVHPLRELRVQPRHPAIQPCLPAREHELRVLVAAIGGGAERRQRLVHTGRPAPQPDRVDVRVPDHVQDRGGGGRRHPLSAPPRNAPTMKRWRTMNTRIAGRMASMPPAARMPVALVA
jgi:hypothetical protein